MGSRKRIDAPPRAPSRHVLAMTIPRHQHNRNISRAHPRAATNKSSRLKNCTSHADRDEDCRLELVPIAPTDRLKSYVMPTESFDQELLLEPQRLDVLRKLESDAGQLFLDGMLKDFADQLPVILAELRGLISTEQRDTAAGAAHALKGRAANLGLKAIAETSGRLDSLLRETEDRDPSQVLVELETLAEPSRALLGEWLDASKNQEE